MKDIEISDFYLIFNEKRREKIITIINRGLNRVLLTLRANRGLNNAKIFRADFVEKVLLPNISEKITIKFIGTHSEPNDPIYLIFKGMANQKLVHKINWEFRPKNSKSLQNPSQVSVLCTDSYLKESNVNSEPYSKSLFEAFVDKNFQNCGQKSISYDNVTDDRLKSLSKNSNFEINQISEPNNLPQNQESVHSSQNEKSNFQLIV
jgi:hypothetical protein